MTATGPHHILVVDDEPVNLTLLSKRLAHRGYQISTAASADEALAIINASRPDLVLLDIFMPKVSGVDLLRTLRENEATASLPVILVSALGDTAHIVRGLAEGANDYVTKPVNQPILLARIEALLRSTDMVRRLEVQTEILSRLAAYDELTGVYNRRSLFHALENEVNRSARYGRDLSVLLLDIDHFKIVNDLHGHAAGDVVLHAVAQRIVEALRSCDTLCRYGGEEFCAILPETNATGAVRAAERVRLAVECAPFETAEKTLAVTVSVGIAAWKGSRGAQIPDLLAGADRALYVAKHSGRNRVHLYDDVSDGQVPPACAS
jgi:two-component system, cell cycle response regulator